MIIKCTKCFAQKPHTAFNKSSAGTLAPDGSTRHYYCKQCDRARVALTNAKFNATQMYVAGKYISKADPHHRPGRYDSWDEVPTDADQGTLIPHPASPPVPKEYDPATAGGMKIVMTRQVRRAFQRRWGLAVHARDTRCIISGASLETDACHVKPVKFCTNIDEARDLNNGVVLRTDLHRLFDRGYFTWDENGWIVPAFGFRMTKQIPCVRWKHMFTPEQQYYIAWHRENKFKPNVMQEKRNVHTHSGLGSKQPTA